MLQPRKGTKLPETLHRELLNRPSLKGIVESIKNNPKPVLNRPIEKAPTRYRQRCEVCEIEFGSSRLDARYCSSKCRQQAYRWR